MSFTIQSWAFIPREMVPELQETALLNPMQGFLTYPKLATRRTQPDLIQATPTLLLSGARSWEAELRGQEFNSPQQFLASII